MALASQGLLTFEASVALILGDNIGTTITAELASIGANVNAHRTARAHTLFNVINAAVFIPLIGFLHRIVERIVPGGDEDLPIEPQLLEKHLLDTPLVAIGQAKGEIVRMATIARRTVQEATRSFFAGDDSSFKRIHVLEQSIDNLQREITK